MSYMPRTTASSGEAGRENVKWEDDDSDIEYAPFADLYRPINYKVEYLNDNNYAIWKIKLLQIIEEYGLEAIVLGYFSRPSPKDPEHPTEKERMRLYKWKKMDLRAQGLIKERVRNTHHHLLVGTSAMIWQRIKTKYAKDEDLGPARAIQSMFSRKWDEKGEHINVFLDHQAEKIHDLRRFQGNQEELYDLIHALSIMLGLPV